MNIVIKSLRISDISRHVSKTITFKEKDNLITSEKNSRGKSVLMKSIYHALGADSMFDSVFPKDEVLFDITFKSDENEYRVLRYKDCFSILKNNILVNYVGSGSRPELSLFFQSEFNTSVYLKNRKKTTELAPPAYLFIPYYLDQDRSWKEEQEPFSKQTMSQYEPLNRNDLYLYHLGLYKDDYGQLKSEIDDLNSDISAMEKELCVLDQSYQDVKKAIDNETIVANADELESLYRASSDKIDKLIEKQEKLIGILQEADKKRINCLISIRNNAKIIEKLKAKKSAGSTMVRCPNCNEEFDVELKGEVAAIYSQVVLEKENESLSFELMQLSKQITELKKQINAISETINDVNTKAIQSRSNYEKYVTRLALTSLLDKQISEISRLNTKLTSLRESKKAKIENLNRIKENTNKAKNDFSDFYSKYLVYLDVHVFSPNDIVAFKKLKLSGSQYVRSTLAFYFAFLKVKLEFNQNGYNFPLVIDSPREGEQDEYNSVNILDFVLSEKINNCQRIVASVNAKNYITPEKLKLINVIELSNEEGQVMTPEEYEKNEKDILMSLAYFKREN